MRLKVQSRLLKAFHSLFHLVARQEELVEKVEECEQFEAPLDQKLKFGWLGWWSHHRHSRRWTRWSFLFLFLLLSFHWFVCFGHQDSVFSIFFIYIKIIPK